MVTISSLYVEYLYVLDSGFAYGGLIIRNHKVVDAAPIFRKLIGRTTGTVKQILSRRGWKIVKIIRRRVSH